MIRRLFAVAVACFFGISPVYADMDTVALDELLVTATRTEKELSDAPGTTAVVTTEDMEMRNIRTVDEALNTMPGVFNRRANPMDTLAAIALRGIPEQKRTLVLLDGMPLNDSYTGGVSFGGLSPDIIDRIEVVQGPFSSLYGGNAMGGVVNLITKLPEKRELAFRSGYGSSWERGDSLDDRKEIFLSYGDRLFDRLSLSASYGYGSTNGYSKDMVVQTTPPPVGITGWQPTTDSQGSPKYLIGDKGDNRRWDDSFTLRAGYDFTKQTSLRASWLKTRYEYNYDAPHTLLRDAAGNPVYSSGSVKEASFLNGSGGKVQDIYQASLKTELSPVSVKINLGFMDQGENWYTTPGSTATRTGGPGKVSSTPSKELNADLQLTVPLLESHLLTVGGGFRHGEASTEEHNLSNWKDEDSTTSPTYRAGGKDMTWSVFVQDEFIIRENLSFFLGFRQDWWETSDGYADQIGSAGYPKNYDERSAASFSPKAAIVFKPFEGTALRVSAGKAFRPPTVYELYRTWTGSTGVVYNGNPDLKPETTVSWDLGVEQELWKGAKAKATYFDNHLSDLIYRMTVSPTQQDYINAGKATSRGVTLEMEQSVENWLRLFANYTYTDAKIKENIAKPTTEGMRLTYMPRNMVNAGAELRKGPLSASFTGRYVGKRYSDDENKDIVNGVYTSYDPFFTADAKVSYAVTKFATVALSVDNIFDRDYFSYYKAPGRSWFGEVTVRF